MKNKISGILLLGSLFFSSPLFSKDKPDSSNPMAGKQAQFTRSYGTDINFSGGESKFRNIGLFLTITGHSLVKLSIGSSTRSENEDTSKQPEAESSEQKNDLRLSLSMKTYSPVVGNISYFSESTIGYLKEQQAGFMQISSGLSLKELMSIPMTTEISIAMEISEKFQTDVFPMIGVIQHF